MFKIATWMREKDAPYFDPFFCGHPEIQILNARESVFDIKKMEGLLLTGGADVDGRFLNQKVPDASLVRDADPERDLWEFSAAIHALETGIPVLAICKGMQLLNVVLGGTLHLDIANHNLPEMKDANTQPLRYISGARHQFEKVNSSHHQAIDKLGSNFEVEAWAAEDGVIEQIRMRNYSFGLGVQYHPERDKLYAPLFEDFIASVKSN